MFSGTLGDGGCWFAAFSLTLISGAAGAIAAGARPRQAALKKTKANFALGAPVEKA
jgi:hypothetical protein